MKTYTLSIKLLSDALINSGEGFGAIIDSDVVFDDVGLPYIPAKRIKGCLRDAAREACEMLKSAQVISFINLDKSDEDREYKIIEQVFGSPGKELPAPAYFSHLTIDDYENNRQWLKYFTEKYTKEHEDVRVILLKNIVLVYSQGTISCPHLPPSASRPPSAKKVLRTNTP